jgi:hypothetical protein
LTALASATTNIDFSSSGVVSGDSLGLPLYAIAYDTSIATQSKVVAYKIFFTEGDDPSTTTAVALRNVSVVYPSAVGTDPAWTFTGSYDSTRKMFTVGLPQAYADAVSGAVPTVQLEYDGQAAHYIYGPLVNPAKAYAGGYGHFSMTTSIDSLTSAPFTQAVKIWISAAADSSIAPTDVNYVYFRILPNYFFPEIYPTANPPVIPAPMYASGGDTRYADPFGKIKTYPTSGHYVKVRIRNSGQPINTSHILAAYVGNELRGKTKIVQYEGTTWAPILIQTTGNEQVRWLIWREGMTEGAHEAIYHNFYTEVGSSTPLLDMDLSWFSIDDVDEVLPLYITEMKNAYPNPFNPTTTVKFSLKQAQKASIMVYNIKGQRVKTLVNDYLEAGHHTVVWNGVDKDNRQTASGIYFIRMQTEGYTKVQKVVLLK